MKTDVADKRPEDIAAFIGDVLNQLSSLAETNGHRGLATTLMLAALDAGRAATPPQAPQA